MNRPPSGWVEAAINELATDVSSGFASGRHNKDSVGIPHLRPMNVSRDGEIDLADVKYVAEDAGERRLAAGDVLFNNTNSPALVGKTAVYRESASVAFSNHMTRVRLHAGVDPRFIARQLHYLWMSGGLSELISNHVNQASISSSRLASDVRVRVAPTPEQERIVAAIEEVFAKLDVGVAGLQAVRQRLKRMREAVLTAAVAGRLVPQDPTDTPAVKILADLGIEPIHDELLPRLRGGWAYARLGELADVVGGVTKDAKRQHDPAFVEVPYLRVANVQRGYLDLTEVATIRVAPQRADHLRLVRGDVLFNEGGDRDKLGRGWIWENQVANCIHQNHVFRARLRDERLQPKVISWWGNSFGKKWFESRGKQTTNLASLNLTTLKSFPVVVGPPGEQLRMVAEVERSLSFIEACERAVDSAGAQAAALRRSVLKAAFEGELVPQDPTDEPASVLLERIRAKRDGSSLAPSRSRRARTAPK